MGGLEKLKSTASQVRTSIIELETYIIRVYIVYIVVVEIIKECPACVYVRYREHYQANSYQTNLP